MVSVLTACGKLARLKEEGAVHGFIIRTSEKSNRILDTSLIDMYSKCHKVDAAQRVAEGKSISPDEITFIGVLCACAQAELLTEGRSYFNQMIDLYKIKPNFAHYWCLANLYSGSGLTERVEEISRKMLEDKELPSESLVWVNVLSSCRFQGDVALGERIAKTLIDMDPHDFSYYQLLLNVYDVAGRKEDVAMVKEQMKERRMGRIPGCSLVDLKEIVHKLKLECSFASDRETKGRSSCRNQTW
ncbi:pentatricopeptide repeat-containing protein At3g51320-like [Mangifera indica]|uniref:pentatricopeptide repeat-containing protein At3g51320-like n=1 Tax=Mangifera indica TaxID=29780 RepID=UPI001CFAA74B|nr:pentatricopeptide repeat-containing protein At3g51320-like [Mangifera indica]